MLRFKSRRINLGVTQRHVADSVGINRTVYSQMESGRVVPRPDEIARLATFFDLPADRLLDHIDESLAGLAPDAESRDEQREVARG